MNHRSSISDPQFSKRGFTIIETLVAITVLMIAIAGPLVIASKGLFGALASKDQMTATYLAQESIETLKNIRDNNLAATPALSWNTLPNGLSLTTTCTSVTVCDASAVDNPQVTDSCTIVLGACQIDLETNTGAYGNNYYGAPTPFRRHFVVTPSPSGDGNEIIVTVYVDWNEGTVPYEIALSSELTDSTR